MIKWIKSILGFSNEKPVVSRFINKCSCSDNRVERIEKEDLQKHIKQYGKHKANQNFIKFFILSSNAKEFNSSWCEDCIPKRMVQNYKRAFSKEYSYLFSTGVCEKCKKTKEIVYIPLARMHFENPNFSIMDWYKKFPRKKEDIEVMLSDYDINFFKQVQSIYNEVQKITNYKYSFEQITDDIRDRELNFTFSNHETHMMNILEGVINLRLSNDYIFEIVRSDITSHDYVSFAIRFETSYKKLGYDNFEDMAAKIGN